MIGTLAYFGILTPSKVLPSRCNFGSEFQCIDYLVSTSGDNNTFKLRLKNDVGESINAQSIALSNEGTTPISCTVNTAVPTQWVSGAIQEFSWGTCNHAAAGFVAGEKGKVLVTITYNTLSSGSSYAKQVKGEIYTTVT